MATSGTTSATVYRTQKVIDTAFRRAGIVPQKVTAELIETAQGALYTYLSGLANLNITLWTIQSVLVPLYAGRQTVPMPQGVVDVMNINLSTLTRLEGTASSSSGTAENAFDGDIETDCTLLAADGHITLALETATRASSFGLLPAASGTWNFTYQGSDDGVTWDTIETFDSQAVVAGQWLWTDVENDDDWLYYRIQASGGTTLNVAEWFVGNTPQDIPLGLINRGDYFNLPNKTFLGRPTQYWLDKQRDILNAMIWPAPQPQFTFSRLVCQVQYYIQDVGTMVQTLDIPQRWFDHVCWKLASIVVWETPDADLSRAPGLDAKAQETYITAIGGESDRAPSRLTPNIRPYTR